MIEDLQKESHAHSLSTTGKKSLCVICGNRLETQRFRGKPVCGYCLTLIKTAY